MPQLYLVRHGQTDWNVEGRYQGQTDWPLNAVGRAQAQALAQQLAGIPFEAVYSSDLKRAWETAEILGAALGVAVQLDERLREINLGEWEGQRVAEIKTRYPAVWAARAQDPLHTRAPGGESAAELAVRVAQAADAVARAHPGGPVLVVSHGVALAALLCLARHSPLNLYRAIPENSQAEVIDWPPAQGPDA